MMFFVDTTHLVGAGYARDERHADGAALLEAASQGTLGDALFSDLVLAETVTILGRKPGVGSHRAVAYARTVLASPRTHCLHLDEATRHQALLFYERHGPALSFADASTVALMRRERCMTLFSHDAGFDRVPGLVRRERP